MDVKVKLIVAAVWKGRELSDAERRQITQMLSIEKILATKYLLSFPARG